MGLWEFTQGNSRGCKVDDTTFDVYPDKWPGINLLEVALMEVRTRLRNNAYTTTIYSNSVEFKEGDFTGFYGYYFSRAFNHQ